MNEKYQIINLQKESNVVVFGKNTRAKNQKIENDGDTRRREGVASTGFGLSPSPSIDRLID